MIILPSRNGMLLRNSNGIISSDCGGFSCPCELLTGTKCSCYGTSLTPSTYIADFGEMGKFCLNYVSGCTWQVTVGTITVTLNLTYATNTTRLTVVDGSTTVFSGDLVETLCNNRKYGIISNTVSPSDWGDVVFTPACSPNCFGRMVELNIDYGSDNVVVSHIPGTYNIYKYRIGRLYNIFGFLDSNCYLGSGADTYKFSSSKYSPSCYNTENTKIGTISISYNTFTKKWFLSHTPNTGFYAEVVQDVDEIGVGESFQVTNQIFKATKVSVCSFLYDYRLWQAALDDSLKDGYMPGTATITVY